MWLHVLFVVCAALVQVSIAANCTIQDNTQYTTAGNLVTLYNVSSVEACCDACEGFEECNFFSYGKDSTSDYYKQCTVKSNLTDGGTPFRTDPSWISGYNSRIYVRPTACSQEVGYFYYSSIRVGLIPAATTTDCCDACAARPGCQYWTLSNNTCEMKITLSNRTAAIGMTSGTVIPPPVPKRTGSKRGVAIYSTKSCSDIRPLTNKITWVYNFEENPGVLEQCYDELGIQFVPMVRSLTSRLDIIYGNSPYLFTFQGPNAREWTNITPQQAADFWPSIEAVAAKYNMTIGSPATVTGGYMDAIDWLDSFFSLCTGCKVDFITVQLYGCTNYTMDTQLSRFRKYNKSVWVTAFACLSYSEQQTLDFTQTILPQFDNDAGVGGYAWYGMRNFDGVYFSNLYNNSFFGLTRLGQLYVNFSSPSSPSSSSSSSSSSSPSSTTSPSSSAQLTGATYAIISVVILCVLLNF